jgi:hypothetical protein
VYPAVRKIGQTDTPIALSRTTALAHRIEFEVEMIPARGGLIKFLS